MPVARLELQAPSEIFPKQSTDLYPRTKHRTFRPAAETFLLISVKEADEEQGGVKRMTMKPWSSS